MEDMDRMYEESFYDLAIEAYNNGDLAAYESLMKEGIANDEALCMMLGFEKEEEWDTLSAEERAEIHGRLAENLPEGVALGSGLCAFALASYKIYGLMGFGIDPMGGVTIALQGLKLGCKECGQLVEEVLARGYVKNQKDDMEEEPEDKTEIAPAVMVIQPSGLVEFVEADMMELSYASKAALIGADGLDAVHFSDPLNSITSRCGLTHQVTMHADRNGISKDLSDNPVATILYGKGYEMRGPVIVALEDDGYNIHSFSYAEDIEAVFEAISEYTGGIVRRNPGQEL